MSRLTQELAEAEGNMESTTQMAQMAQIESTAQINAPKSLAQQRVELCLQLQANRRLLARKLVGPESDNQFPRSAAMRFISNHSTQEILHKAANAALGLQTFRALRWGVTALKFVRNSFKKL